MGFANTETREQAAARRRGGPYPEYPADDARGSFATVESPEQAATRNSPPQPPLPDGASW